jgi:hypothetical protein
MPKFGKWSAAGYAALGLMCVLWVWAGWHILYASGFYSTPRHTTATVHVVGIGAIFMAFIFLGLAAISTAIILKHLNAPRAACAAAAALILGLPAVFALM